MLLLRAFQWKELLVVILLCSNISRPNSTISSTELHNMSKLYYISTLNYALLGPIVDRVVSGHYGCPAYQVQATLN